MSTALTSRNYSQDPAIYNKTVEPLFPKLQRMKEQLDNPRHELSEAEIQDSIVLCELIFAAKQSPMNAKAMISTI
jgi:[acyl-carrier-protein] S-malonyltransferase